ncbi:MAG TPA: efflux RND transporter periplasmic adaptor subunit [Candidatus Ozemobacteraceae bacterium]|nr:efflux RND transporter periplasmic adaptor subunit [Candidatus Ozemobacteraceae bacterium]
MGFAIHISNSIHFSPAALLLAALLSFAAPAVSAAQEAAEIRMTGTIEVDDAELSFKLPGRLESRLVSEGEAVQAGQVLAKLDTSELEQEFEIRRGELEAAEAALADLEAGSRPEELAQAEAARQKAQAMLSELLAGSRAADIAATEAATRRTRADREQADKDLARAEALHAGQSVTDQDLDRARTAARTALERQTEAEARLRLVREGPRREQIEQARQAESEAAQRLALLRQGPRKDAVSQAQARARIASHAVALARIRLDNGTLVSPVSGTVLAQHAEPGEYLSAGTPVVTVAPLDHLWMRAYIHETDLGRVVLGQTASVTIDTWPDRVYSGTLAFISPQTEFTPKTIQTEKERITLVYRVKIRLDNPKSELKPGMPAVATLRARE